MKDLKIKGAIEDKISSKLNEMVQEFKIEKGRSISKAIDESSKKIARVIAKKIKKAAKERVSDETEKASMLVKAKAKVKSNSTPEILKRVKPGLQSTKSLSSPKPTIRKENKATPLKNQSQRKNRKGILKESKGKAIP